MLLEIFAEERLVGKVQFLGDFLYALSRVLELYAQLEGDVFVYPFVGRAAAYGLDGFRQVFRRYAELLAIPRYAALPAEVLLYEMYEAGEYRLGACLLLGVPLLHVVHHMADVVYHRCHQRAHHVATEMMVDGGHLAADKIEIRDYIVRLVGAKLEDGMRAREEEERGEVVHSLQHLVEEVLRHHDGYAAEVWTEPAVVEHLPLTDYYHVVGFYRAFLCIYCIPSLALQAEPHKDAVHPLGHVGHGDCGEIAKQQQFVAYRRTVIELPCRFY